MNLQKVERRSEVQQAALASEKPVMRQAKRMKDGLMNTDKIASGVCHRWLMKTNKPH